MTIHYKSGYKYQLAQPYSVATAVTGYKVEQPFFSLASDGQLSINMGYAWDGPSGPAVDSRNFMRPSLVHDCGYQMIRQDLLSEDTRLAWDQLLRKMCLEDGMTRMRAWWVYRAVRWQGDKHTDRPNPVLQAP